MFLQSMFWLNICQVYNRRHCSMLHRRVNVMCFDVNLVTRHIWVLGKNPARVLPNKIEFNQDVFLYLIEKVW